MTKRDFFILLIKIFGLYSLIATLISGLPRQLISLVSFFNPISIIIIVGAFSIVIGLFALLIFKADKVVNLLKLDRGFQEDRIDFEKLEASQLVQMATFIIGGLVFIDHLPNFIYQSIFAFEARQIGLKHDEMDKINWFTSGLNLLIGYLLLSNYDFVAKKLKTQKTNTPD